MYDAAYPMYIKSRDVAAVLLEDPLQNSLVGGSFFFSVVKV